MAQMKCRDGNKVRRQERQESAKVRKEVAANRTPAQRLASLDTAKLTAKKERVKLMKLLNPKQGTETLVAKPAPVAATEPVKTEKKAKKNRKQKDAA